MTADAGSRQGIRAVGTPFRIGGITVFECDGIANSVTPNRAGDLCIDYSAGKLYVAGAATASTDWALVTSA